MQFSLAARRAAAQPATRRFSEYFRCYPFSFMPGNANGFKFSPLDKVADSDR